MRTRTERILAGVCLLIPLVAAFGLAFSRMLFPFDSGQYEGGLWAPARLLFHGENPYTSRLTREPPFVMSPYGPVYYWLLGLGLELFGPQFWFGRAVSTISAAIATWCLAFLVLRFTRETRLAVLAAAVFLSQLPVQFWLGLQRPDLLALALSLLALVAVLADRVHPLVSMTVGALSAQAAIWTRQTSVSAVLAILGWYLVRRQPARAAMFALVSAVFVAGVALWMNTASDGGFVWQQVVLPSQVERNLGQLTRLLGALAEAPSTWVVALACLSWGAVALHRWWHTLRHGRPRSRAHRPRWADDSERSFTSLTACYLVAAIAVAAGTSTRAGSNINYWLEVCAVSAMAVPLALRSLAPERYMPGANLVLLAAFALSSATTAYRLARVETAHWTGAPYLRAIVARLRDVEPTAGPVLTAFPELAEYAGRAYYFNDGIQYDRRSPEHNAILLETLRARTYPAVVLPFDTAPRGYARSELGNTPPPYPVFLFLRR